LFVQVEFEKPLETPKEEKVDDLSIKTPVKGELKYRRTSCPLRSVFCSFIFSPLRLRGVSRADEFVYYKLKIVDPLMSLKFNMKAVSGDPDLFISTTTTTVRLFSL
jgi:hypothetical protein